MNRLNVTKLPIILSAVLIFTLIFMLTFTLPTSVSYADENPTVQSSIKIGQISDIHYFPYNYCYTETYRTDNDYYESTDFFACMTGDTKLVLESGITLAAQIKEIIEDAKLGKAPQYFMVTGDLCKNGERIALIDVANALRYLQNEVRKVGTVGDIDYSSFQVFVITGNHDLYNESSEAYRLSDGSGYETDVVTSKDFALIFAGLGFPNANIEETAGEINLTDYLEASHWSSSFTGGYIHSTNATNLDFTYFSSELNKVKDEDTSIAKLNHYISLGDSLHQLSYYAKLKDSSYSFFAIDATDRESVEKGKGGIQRISKLEYDKNYKGNQKKFDERQFYLAENVGGIVEISRTPKTMSQINAAFDEDKAVYCSAEYSHYTGGRIRTEVLDWMEGLVKDLEDESVTAEFHMNALPHWEQEDDILKDFCLYNWEYVTKRLLDMGIRYVYTGHQHASDVMYYTDIEGRTLYDMETGSMISYDSPRRYTTITRYEDNGNFVGETFESELYILDSLKEIPDALTDLTPWNQSAFESAYASYKLDPTEANWTNVINSNPTYTNYILKYEELSVYSYNEFINGDIYSRLLDRIIGHVFNDSLVDTLKGLVGPLFHSGGTVMNLITNIISADDLTGLVNYLIDEIAYGLWDEYPNGVKEDSVITYLLDFINNFLNLEFGDASLQSSVNPDNKGKMNVKEIASFIMTAHAGCTEIILCNTDAELQAEYLNIDSKFSEVAYSDSTLAKYSDTQEVSEFRFMNPQDATYRKRMTAAVKDLHETCVSGDFAEFLFYALFSALYKTDGIDANIENNSIYKNLGNDNYFKKLNQDESILKQLLEHKFDLKKATTEIDPNTGNPYITLKAFDSVKKLFNQIPTLLPNILKLALSVEVKTDININPENLVLLDVINSLMPLVKNLLGSLIGFNVSGDTLYEALDNAISGYITRSFEIGLGGIADNIIVAYATDVYPELVNQADPYRSTPFLFNPYQAYSDTLLTYGGINMTYVKGKEVASKIKETLNPATQENGRVASRLTTSYDNEDASSEYIIKFYTEENVFATFILKDEKGNEIGKVSTSKATQDRTLDKKGILNKPYIDSQEEKVSNDGGTTLSILKQTKPQYVPLIDLGILCITHGEIADDEDIPFTYQDRDSAVKNSVIFYNVTTVKLSKLKADTKYTYDIVTTYKKADGTTLSFSLAEYKGVSGFNIKTAKDKKSNDSFEFLAIADIQGMLPSMYEDSFKAVKALMADSSTSNFDFFINAGDMCDNPKNFNQWQWACDTYFELFANYPQMFTAGNHEGSTYAMTDYFNYSLPMKNKKDTYQSSSELEGGIFYSFDYGTLHVTVLNTNQTDDKGLNSAQLTWLKNDLKNTQAKWKIVLMHKSLYSGGSHSYDGEVVAMRNQLVPIFASNGVSIVFAGHDHTYTSTVLVDGKGQEVSNMTYSDGAYATDAGTLYITLGTMGTKFYEYSENPITAALFDNDNSINETLTSQTFGKVKIDGDKLTYKAYYYDKATDKVVLFSTIDLSKDNSLILDTIKGNIKLDKLSYSKSIDEIADAVIIDPTLVPAGYSIIYSKGSETLSSLNDLSFKGKSVDLDVYLVDRNGNQELLGTLTIENASYSKTLGMAVGIPVAIVVVVAVVVVVIVVLKKKKKA